MMDYINRVLSHIRNKNEAEKIELELFDHINEHKKFFEEIGYDEKSAEQKAEEKMGDADVVGEQLFLRTGRGKQVVIILMSLLCLAGAIINFSNESEFELFNFVCTSVLFCFNILCIIFATKRKSLLSTIILAVSSFYPSYMLGNYLYIALVYRTKGYAFGMYFFSFGPELSGEGVVICAFIHSIIIISLLNSLVVYIKTKRLENTKYDIKKCKIITIALAVLMVLTIAFTTFTACQTDILKRKMYDYTVKNCERISQNFLENIDSFITLDKNKISTVLDSTFDNEEYAAYGFDRQSECTDLPLVVAFYKDIPSSLEIEINNGMFNPIPFGDDACIMYVDEIKESDAFGGMSITQAPLPARIYFKINRDECKLLFRYDDSYTDELPKSFIEFIYDYDKKDFVLADSSLFEYNKSMTLSTSQQMQLNKELKKELEARSYYYDEDINAYLQLYDVNYCDKAGDGFCKVDLSYLEYTTMQGKFTSRVLHEGVSMIVKLDGNSLSIIEEYSNEKGSDCSQRFSKKARLLFEKRDREWYSEALN